MQRNLGTRLLLSTAALAVCGALSPSAQAASISADLTCVLNGLSSRACVAGPSFGTVTLAETITFGELKLSVDLFSDDMKFKDFMLAYDGTATSITSDPAGFALSVTGYSIPPYSGKFNLGKVSVGKGGDWSWVLKGDVPLTLEDFLGATDTGGKLSVALHIQAIGPDGCEGNDDGTTDCVPGQAGDDEGEGSLKIGGVFSKDPGDDVPPVPEPSTMLLFGGALLGLGLLGKKRNS